MELIRYPDPHPDNLAAALGRIGPRDLVVDVGGWWKPLNRADHVIDLLPYESRAGGGRLGNGHERYSEATWASARHLRNAMALPKRGVRLRLLRSDARRRP